jgi:nicotinate-nucleotide adenylyltransferase
MALALPTFGDRRRRRVGLLGGSFNPAHEGHVHISREAKKRLGLHDVWWLVSPQNPLKPARGMAGHAQRLAGALKITRGSGIVVSDLESRVHLTRTAQVVRLLTARYPRLSFVWLMGADNLEQIPRWGRWTQIFRTLRVAVLDRSPYSYRALAGAAAIRFRRFRKPRGRDIFSADPIAWSYLAIRRHDASGTAIRAAKTGKNRRRPSPTKRSRKKSKRS